MRPAKTKFGQWMQRSMRTASISYETGKPVDDIIAERNKNYSRRNFITDTAKLAALGFAANGLYGCTKSISGEDEINSATDASYINQQKKKIAIIGAGIAGLNAAITLQEKGITADVYEASQRAGGRMFTGYNILGEGLSTELGAEFIDTDHAEMIRLVRKYNLELLDTFQQSEQGLSDTLYFNGNYYSEADAAKEFLKLLPKIIPDKRSLSPNINAFHYSESDRFFDNMTMTQYLDRIGSAGWFREAMISLQLSENGASPDVQSALNLLLYADVANAGGRLHVYYSNERYKIKGGNQQLPILMAKDVTNGVKYGYELKKVTSNNGLYTVNFTKKDGSNFSASYDIVLFALPFTILRNVTLDIPLPQWKRDVINQHGYGNNAKLLLGFKKRYWRDNGLNGGFLTDNETQGGWDNTTLQPGTTGGITIYKCSDEAVALGDGTIQQQVDTNLPLLNDVLPGAIDNFNNKAQRMVWPTYPYSKASYSCYFAGQYTTLLGKQIIPVDNLYFAGEHCSINYWGFMNGAAETGRAAALSIIKKLKSISS